MRIGGSGAHCLAETRPGLESGIRRSGAESDCECRAGFVVGPTTIDQLLAEARAGCMRHACMTKTMVPFIPFRPNCTTASSIEASRFGKQEMGNVAHLPTAVRDSAGRGSEATRRPQHRANGTQSEDGSEITDGWHRNPPEHFPQAANCGPSPREDRQSFFRSGPPQTFGLRTSKPRNRARTVRTPPALRASQYPISKPDTI